MQTELTFVCPINKSKVGFLVESGALDLSRGLHKKFHKTFLSAPNGQLTTTYIRGESFRLFPAPGTCSPFSCDRYIRGILCEGLTQDVDAGGCHPRILQWLLSKQGVVLPILDEYLDDRPALAKKLNLSLETVKDRFNQCINKDVVPKDTRFIPIWASIYGTDGLYSKWDALFPTIPCKSKHEAAYWNVRASQFSRVWAYHESLISEFAMGKVAEWGLRVAFPSHDGFQVVLPIPDDLCARIEQAVREQFAGLRMSFVLKPHQLVPNEKEEVSPAAATDAKRVVTSTSVSKRLKTLPEQPGARQSVVTHHSLDPIRVRSLLAFLYRKGALPASEREYDSVKVDNVKVFQWLTTLQNASPAHLTYRVSDQGGRFWCSPALNLGTLPPPVRGYLAGSDFLDIDMACAGATITRHLLRTKGVTVDPFLNLWIDDRAAAMALIKTDNKRFLDSALLRDEPPPAWSKVRPIWDSVYASQLLPSLGFEGGANRVKFFVRALRDRERVALVAAAEAVPEGVACLCHDGFLVHHSLVPDVDRLLSLCSAKVEAALPGVNMRFKLKPFEKDSSWEALVAASL